MTPRVQYHASVTVHSDVQSHTVEVLIDDVAHNLSLDFGEGLVSGVDIGARVAGTGSGGVPEEVVVAVAVDAGTDEAEGVGVG